ncbi:MAG TPA: PKD domain-containing protein [Candidatus Saccharibacteria bacterium]|nr:PKD domain-containing protein [Candidatus Saccharibacteria bacterium]
MTLKLDPNKRQQRKQKRAEHIVRSVETARSYQKPIKSRIKISHNRHTGKKLPIHCTSYAALFFILVFTGLVTLFISQQSVTAGPPISESSAVTVSGVVPTDPPTSAASISSPANGTNFSSGIINVSGRCVSGLLVEIYRDNSFAGSQICDSNGEYLIKITLISGKNILVAKISDSLGQYGPDSDNVIVYFNESIPQSDDSITVIPGTSSSNPVVPLLVSANPVQRGTFPKQLMKLEYEVEGGVAPYAMSIDWGDGSDPTVRPHKKSGDFSSSYIYQKAGQYTIRLSATDSAKNKAFTQTIAIVNGIPEPLSTNVFDFASAVCVEQQGLSGIGQLNNSNPAIYFGLSVTDIFGNGQSIACKIIQNSNIIWPMFVVASTMTISFWLGERIVLHRYKTIIKSN